jgi:hypothetical protein
LHRSSLSLFWISLGYTARLAAVLQFPYVIPFSTFTFKDFAVLYDIFLRFSGFSEPRAIAIDRFSVLFARLPALLLRKHLLQRGQDLGHRFFGQRPKRFTSRSGLTVRSWSRTTYPERRWNRQRIRYGRLVRLSSSARR